MNPKEREFLQAIGIDGVFSPTSLNRLEEPRKTPPLLPQQAQTTAARSLPSLPNIKTLDELRTAMAAFEDCSLKKTAMNMVFSDGNPKASLMVIGEAPGADEDRQGKPFVGQSGQLLRKILGFIGIGPDQVYITNVLPYRPPGNRQPTPLEIELFLPFLQKHIALIRPRCLLLAGGTSCKALLNTKDGITRIRGRWMDLVVPELEAPVKTMATYHPAYLLRSPLRKKDVWQDMLVLKDFLAAAY